MIYVRLTRFAKTEEQCKSDLDKMLFIFKNAHTLGKVPKSFNKTVFKRLFEISRISNFTEEELMDYESDMKRFSDHANALAYADEKGEAAALAVSFSSRNFSITTLHATN
ncbi:MAG: Rpn family recombination-promoting nuclease/putative transposase [Fibromonadales bacterium]|nr:Rpn family recombination-promoting nuclease/putative transposase [Fibromonadales bacterium]